MLFEDDQHVVRAGEAVQCRAQLIAHICRVNALDLSISWNSHSVAFLETKLQLNLIGTVDPKHVHGWCTLVTAHRNEVGEAQ